MSTKYISAGPRDAPVILFIHGMTHSKQAFETVLAGPLAARYRLVAMDLPGHGDYDVSAGTPLARAMLGDAVARVIAELGLARPWLAGWSFGGSAIGEYLRKFGDTALGGLLYLAGAVRNGREAAPYYGPAMMTHARSLLSDDPAVYAAAARGFLSDAAHVALDPALDAAMLAEMLRVPAHVRKPLLAGPEDYLPALAATTVPIATIHGAFDTVVLPAMSDLVATSRPDVTAIRIPGAGHLPWIETPALFEAAIAQVVRP